MRTSILTLVLAVALVLPASLASAANTVNGDGVATHQQARTKKAHKAKKTDEEAAAKAPKASKHAAKKEGKPAKAKKSHKAKKESAA